MTLKCNQKQKLHEKQKKDCNVLNDLENLFVFFYFPCFYLRICKIVSFFFCLTNFFFLFNSFYFILFATKKEKFFFLIATLAKLRKREI